MSDQPNDSGSVPTEESLASERQRARSGPKTREWWIYLATEYSDDLICRAPFDEHGDDSIHVIEHSAYQALVDINQELMRERNVYAHGSCLLTEENIKLRAQLATVTARKDEYLSRCQEYSTTIAGLAAERDVFNLEINNLRHTIAGLEAELADTMAAASIHADEHRKTRHEIERLEAELAEAELKEDLSANAYEVMRTEHQRLKVENERLNKELMHEANLRLDQEWPILKERDRLTAANEVLVEALVELADYTPSNSNVEFMAYVASQAIAAAAEKLK